MDAIALVVVVGVVAFIAVVEHRRSPACRWCGSRHYGRCMFNPRSGRVFANVHDGHFNYNDPNR